MANDREKYCLGIHAKILIELAIKEKPIKFTEPCIACKYHKVCDFNWLEYLSPALYDLCGLNIDVPIGGEVTNHERG